MSVLPFSISTEATAWIMENLRLRPGGLFDVALCSFRFLEPVLHGSFQERV
jgi:hypothetical protein